MPRKITSSRRKIVGVAVGAALVVGVLGGGFAAAAGVFSSPRAHLIIRPTLQSESAASAMAGAFSRSSSVVIPADVSSTARTLAAGSSGESQPAGDVLVDQGQLLLSAHVGSEERAIYAFPTSNGWVCFVMDGLGSSCKSAFPVGEPATVDGGSLYFPASSGPPGELAGFTEDGVTNVQVVIGGTAYDAVLGNHAWYFQYPDNQTPATAATKVIVTLKDGSTAMVPTNITAPPASSPTTANGG